MNIKANVSVINKSLTMVLA